MSLRPTPSALIGQFSQAWASTHRYDITTLQKSWQLVLKAQFHNTECVFLHGASGTLTISYYRKMRLLSKPTFRAQFCTSTTGLANIRALSAIFLVHNSDFYLWLFLLIEPLQAATLGSDISQSGELRYSITYIKVATTYGHNSIYYIVDYRQWRGQQRYPDPQHTLITLLQALSGGEGQSDLLLQPDLHHKDGVLRQTVCPKLWSKSI